MLALCLVSLPLIINAKASSLVKIHPEGVDFDMDSFPIVIDSGSTYCLSDTRADFEGELKRMNVKIQGISEAKGKVLYNGKYRMITVQNLCSKY
jgi:hypothetical protein